MSRGIFAAAFITAALAFAGPGSAARTGQISCGTIGGEFLHVTVTNTTCTVAKDKVIFFTMQGEKAPGWICTKGKPAGQNTPFKCAHSGGEAVSYTYHA